MIKKLIVVLLLLSAILNAELFKQSNLGVGLIVGGGSVTTTKDGTQNYTIVGLNADYFVIDNLSVGIGYMSWFGSSPSLNQLTIPVTYYVPMNKKVRPYAGVFLRETFVSSGYKDYESYGGKVGAAMRLSPTSYVGVGLMAERYSSCSAWQEDCSSVYPEVIFAFSF